MEHLTKLRFCTHMLVVLFQRQRKCLRKDFGKLFLEVSMASCACVCFSPAVLSFVLTKSYVSNVLVRANEAFHYPVYPVPPPFCSYCCFSLILLVVTAAVLTMVIPQFIKLKNIHLTTFMGLT